MCKRESNIINHGILLERATTMLVVTYKFYLTKHSSKASRRSLLRNNQTFDFPDPISNDNVS